MHHQYKTCGTCSRLIDFDLENGCVSSVSFLGGCNGNLQGIARLVEGQDARKVIETLRGVDCNGKGTSCPDQLANALEQALGLEK
ncbi:MAG: TIGR03905 family TSCPD domain-containing protein [Bacteroidales bacterium]|nr:TIGR03905 family TSCPD domain-containing protein [Bacteroidales bacterium]